MATTSFLIKGWTLTVSVTLLSVAANQTSWRLSLMAAVPLTVFWLLDGYFLRHERLFRLLYEDVRQLDTDIQPFSMDTSAYDTRVGTGSTHVSHTLRMFYGSLTIVTLAVTALLLHYSHT
jgi:hypothetical protein